MCNATQRARIGHARNPFGDLKAQYQTIKDDVDRAVLDVFENAQFALGPQVAAFGQADLHHPKGLTLPGFR